MREAALERIQLHKLIAIVRGLPIELLEGLASALLEGGIDLIEVTFWQNMPATWARTAAGIEMLCKKFANRILPGAGTVMTLEQLKMAHAAGAKYIISPNADREIIRETKRLGLVSLPGALTPTKISAAHRYGADMVKVFPAGHLGAAYIKALASPLNHIPMLAVGGINENNASAFIQAGAQGIGVGGNLVNTDWISKQRFADIAALARQFVAAVSGQGE